MAYRRMPIVRSVLFILISLIGHSAIWYGLEQFTPHARVSNQVAVSLQESSRENPISLKSKLALHSRVRSAQARSKPDSLASLPLRSRALDVEAHSTLWARYLNELREYLVSNTKVSPVLSRGVYRVEVDLMLDLNGAFRDVTIVSSSGRPALDSLVLQKLSDVSSFRPPPPGLLTEVPRIRIPFVFYSQR